MLQALKMVKPGMNGIMKHVHTAQVDAQHTCRTVWQEAADASLL